MRDAAFEPAKVASLLTTLGLATAFAHTFAFRLGWAAFGIAMLYLPGLVVLWTEPGSPATALVTTVYLIYVYLSLMRSHADYQHRLNVDQDLRDQRDLFARQSRIDPLTDLANRRHFAEVLSAATRQARTDDKPLSLLLLDIDHFKAINDAHGHDAGDDVLREFALRLKKSIRGIDLACRYGGEEFVIVMPETDMAVATVVAERLRRRIASERFSIQQGASAIEVTISVGIATLDAAGDTAANIIKRADQALYRAKRDGRNRVVADAA
jgi:two-component system cell cycle response regulator